MAKITDYVKESYHELKYKVSWPTMAELNNSTVVVFIASLIIALIIFTMDMFAGVHPTLVWKGVLGYLYGMML